MWVCPEPAPRHGRPKAPYGSCARLAGLGVSGDCGATRSASRSSPACPRRGRSDALPLPNVDWAKLRVVCSHARSNVRRQELLLLRVFFSEDHQRNVAPVKALPVVTRVRLRPGAGRRAGSRPSKAFTRFADPYSRCSGHQPEANHGRLQNCGSPGKGAPGQTKRAPADPACRRSLPPTIPWKTQSAQGDPSPFRDRDHMSPTKYQSID